MNVNELEYTPPHRTHIVLLCCYIIVASTAADAFTYSNDVTVVFVVDTFICSAALCRRSHRHRCLYYYYHD